MILHNFTSFMNFTKNILGKYSKTFRNNNKFGNLKYFHTSETENGIFSFETFPFSKEKIIWSRGTCIVPKHIGRIFFIHNGKFYISVQISPKMLGHKFGEFALTRKTFHKKKNLLKNTKKKK